jgi:hypothetical protein
MSASKEGVIHVFYIGTLRLPGCYLRAFAALALGLAPLISFTPGRAVAASPGAAEQGEASSDGPTANAYNEAHPILAYYYGWWEPEKLASWGIHQPVRLPNAQRVRDDADLVREHIKQALGAGIDGA